MRLTMEERILRQKHLHSSAWRQIREAKIFIHENTCTDCGNHYDRAWHLVVHHVDYNWENNDWDNLRLLCRKCHRHHHRNEPETIHKI